MITVSDYFGSLVFDDVIMKATLSDDVYRSLRKTIDEGAKLESDVANAVAVAMKDWAVKNGEYTGFVVRKKIIANISSTYEELVQAVESSEK